MYVHLSFILQFTKGRRQSETLIDKICIRISSLAIAGAPSGGGHQRSLQSGAPGQGPLSLEEVPEASAESLFCTQRARSLTQGAPHQGSMSLFNGAPSETVIDACLFVYLEAIIAIILAAPNTTKAMQRLTNCWHLIRSAVGASRIAASQIAHLCRRGALKVAGRARNKHHGGAPTGQQQPEINASATNNEVNTPPCMGGRGKEGPSDGPFWGPERGPLKGPQYKQQQRAHTGTSVCSNGRGAVDLVMD